MLDRYRGKCRSSASLMKLLWEFSIKQSAGPNRLKLVGQGTSHPDVLDILGRMVRLWVIAFGCVLSCLMCHVWRQKRASKLWRVPSRYRFEVLIWWTRQTQHLIFDKNEHILEFVLVMMICTFYIFHTRTSCYIHIWFTKKQFAFPSQHLKAHMIQVFQWILRSRMLLQYHSLHPTLLRTHTPPVTVS